MNLSGGNLLMAFDCLTSDRSVKDAIASAALLSRNFGWTPQAVAVMSPDQLSWPTDFTKTWRDEFEKLGENALSSFLQRNRQKGNFPEKVVLQSYHSRSESVRSMITEAKRKKASAIAVFTHTRQRGPTLPGGFISSLIHQSPLPVLALNANAPAINSVQTLLVATDFSAEGLKAFKEAIQLAQITKAKLVLVHVFTTLVNETMVASAGLAGGWNNVEAYLYNEQGRIKAKAKRWIAKAQDQGVSASFELIGNCLSVSSAILKSADKNRADLIVVTEKVGPWASIVLGSVTRDILASAEQPVLVMPTRTKRAKH